MACKTVTLAGQNDWQKFYSFANTGRVGMLLGGNKNYKIKSSRPPQNFL
jgi:hypothetical protein